MVEADESQIRDVVEAYFKGTYYGDEPRLLKAFHPDAHIVGNFDGGMVDWSRTEFIQRVTTRPTQAERGDIYAKNIITIDSVKDAGMVMARVCVDGQVFSDYISLLKIYGQWVIRHKIFTNAQAE